MRLGNGPKKITLTRDSEGYREYRVEYRVYTDVGQGPNSALYCPGLPLVGSRYSFSSDLDIWCWCRWDAQVTPVVEEDGWPKQYIVSLLFANKPLGPRGRCQDVQLNDPLLQPPKVSGSGTRYSEEAWFDRFGKKILTSSHEPVRGAQVEFDANRPQIKISMNVLSYNQVLLAQNMQDCVNSLPIWGWPRRCVKLSSAPFQRQYYGTCLVYYSLDLEFDINPRTFDRYVADEGTKALHGRWDLATGNEWELLPLNAAAVAQTGATPIYGKASNPAHFSAYKDRFGQTTTCILDGSGKPVVTLDPTEVLTCVECPEGAPRKWEVFGLLGSTGLILDRVILTYTANCDWRGTAVGTNGATYQFLLQRIAGQVITEQVNPGLNRTATNPWALQMTNVTAGNITKQWICSAVPPTIAADPTSVFNCSDNNTFSHVRIMSDDGTNFINLANSDANLIGGQVDLPDEIELAPYTGTAPGVIKVERYNEANFFLLGVPTAFV